MLSEKFGQIQYLPTRKPWPGVQWRKRVQNAIEMAMDLFEFFSENEVYFDDGLVGQIGSLEHEYRKLLAPILAVRNEQYTRLPTGQTVLSLSAGLAEAVNKLSGLESALIKLRKTIREMLQ